MGEQMSIAEALDILGPIRAAVSTQPEPGERNFWLDGKKVTAHKVKVEAQKVKARRALK